MAPSLTRLWSKVRTGLRVFVALFARPRVAEPTMQSDNASDLAGNGAVPVGRPEQLQESHGALTWGSQEIMSTAFIIMQIGDAELDRVCRDAIVPALRACGLDPKRVDKHNQGGLLKSEIIAFIEKADIIVADVTNERPNCYLEVGYTMGVDKFRNLILTAREDHKQDSPRHKAGGAKVHFDLTGYDVLFWDPAKVEEFRVELEKRIKRRQAIMVPTTPASASPWDTPWIEEHRKAALAGLERIGRSGYMEVAFALSQSKLRKSQQELLDAATTSVLPTGWPFALVMSGEEYRPRPRTFGIVAEVVTTNPPPLYDYWAIKRDGDFYTLRSLTEDGRDPTKLWFDVRITRITEALLYCARLYSRLGVESSAAVNVSIRHAGLAGRVLAATGDRHVWERKTTESEVETELTLPLSRIESDLVKVVKEFTAPIFTLFEFFELADQVYEDIVNKFVASNVR